MSVARRSFVFPFGGCFRAPPTDDYDLPRLPLPPALPEKDLKGRLPVVISVVPVIPFPQAPPSLSAPSTPDIYGRGVLCYETFPRIFDLVLQYSSLPALLRLRGTCTDVRSRVDEILNYHVVVRSNGTVAPYGFGGRTPASRAAYGGVDEWTTLREEGSAHLWTADVRILDIPTANEVQRIKDILPPEETRITSLYAIRLLHHTCAKRRFQSIQTRHTQTHLDRSRFSTLVLFGNVHVPTPHLIVPECVARIVLNLDYSAEFNRWHADFVDIEYDGELILEFVIRFRHRPGCAAAGAGFRYVASPRGVLEPLLWSFARLRSTTPMVIEKFTFVDCPDIPQQHVVNPLHPRKKYTSIPQAIVEFMIEADGPDRDVIVGRPATVATDGTARFSFITLEQYTKRVDPEQFRIEMAE